uniref:Baseplate wedge protein n=1 Tax=Myoviridae sp. ct17M4 TaxID=2825016 RepID=A0A8S5TVB6_9CAUD|nr:MAG TPA: Baseplate wedge protein [Myoviridae sp. ct17M4]
MIEGDETMAYDLAMDVSTSDLIVQGGDLMIVDNAERVAQQVLITLREWLGEWFLKTSDGIPYLEYILVKTPNEAHIRQILTQAIESVEGVKDVTELEFAFNHVLRTLAVAYEIDTDYGLITRKEVLGYGR